MDIFKGILIESTQLLNKMSPYLLFGFLVAGIIHILFSVDKIAGYLGGQDFKSTLKASLIGVPLPLCSCGVIPTALALRKKGASKGAVLSFLISTPTTGVDSIFATYSLLGPVFTVYRILASFFAGLLAGVTANIFAKEKIKKPVDRCEECKLCDVKHRHSHTLAGKIKAVFTYAFGDLLIDTGKWLFIGILIGGAIAYFMPQSFVEMYMGNRFLSIIIMVLIGMPMYVCATGSIPIAAALMIKGLNPGAAFAFLVAGPATNTVTIAVVAKYLGKKALAIYLSSIAVVAIGLGLLLDALCDTFFKCKSPAELMHSSMMPEWVGVTCSILLILFWIRGSIFGAKGGVYSEKDKRRHI